MGEWIPVAERTPEDFDRVLIWWSDKSADSCGYGFGYCVEDMWYGDAKHYGRKVLAWMPLPPRYDGG